MIFLQKKHTEHQNNCKYGTKHIEVPSQLKTSDIIKR